MSSVNETGGAKIGWANVTWPFASLHVTETELILNATIVGKLIFTPSDIKSIEVFDYLPFIGQGIKINHHVESYKNHVVFWTFKNPVALIQEIKKTGFLDHQTKSSTENSFKISEMQKTGGFPLKLTFAIAVIVLWNLLSFIDMKALIQDGKLLVGFGKGFLLSTGVILLTSLLMLISPGFQKVALKEGREIKDFSKFIYFIMLIVGILFISRVLVDL